jgi:hypothetical protein
VATYSENTTIKVNGGGSRDSTAGTSSIAAIIPANSFAIVRPKAKPVGASTQFPRITVDGLPVFDLAAISAPSGEAESPAEFHAYAGASIVAHNGAGFIYTVFTNTP